MMTKSGTNEFDHIEFVVTLHCKICKDVSSLAVKLNTSAASEQLSKYIDAHRHQPDMWVV